MDSFLFSLLNAQPTMGSEVLFTAAARHGRQFLTLRNVLAAAVAYLVLRLVYQLVAARRSLLNKLPGPKSHNWLVGNLPYVRSQATGSILNEWQATYGNTYASSRGVLSPPVVITSDLTALAHIQRNPDLFIKPPVQGRMLGKLAGYGVLVAEFHDHRRQRRILNPAFSPASVRDMVPIIYTKAAELRDRVAAVISDDTKGDASPTPPKPEDIVPGARKLDMGKYLTEMAFDVIGVVGCDYDFHCGCGVARR